MRKGGFIIILVILGFLLTSQELFAKEDFYENDLENIIFSLRPEVNPSFVKVGKKSTIDVTLDVQNLKDEVEMVELILVKKGGEEKSLGMMEVISDHLFSRSVVIKENHPTRYYLRADLLMKDVNDWIPTNTVVLPVTTIAKPTAVSGTVVPDDIVLRLKRLGIHTRDKLLATSTTSLAKKLKVSTLAVNQLKQTVTSVEIPVGPENCLSPDDLNWQYYAPSNNPNEAPIELNESTPPMLPWIAQENNGQDAMDERWYPDPEKGWIILGYNLGREDPIARSDYAYVLAYNRYSGLARFFLWTFQPNQFFSKIAVHFELMDVSNGLVDQPIYYGARIFPNSSRPSDWEDNTLLFSDVEETSWSRAEFPLFYDERIYAEEIPLGLRVTIRGIDESSAILSINGITEGKIQGEVTKTTSPSIDLMGLVGSGVKAYTKKTPEAVAQFGLEAASAFYTLYMGEPEIEVSTLEAALRGTFYGNATGSGVTIFPQKHFWFLIPHTFDPNSIDTALLAETELPRCDIYLGAFGFDKNPALAPVLILPEMGEEIIEPDYEDNMGSNNKPITLPDPEGCMDPILEIGDIPNIIIAPDTPVVVGMDQPPEKILSIPGNIEIDLASNDPTDLTYLSNYVGNGFMTRTYYRFDIYPTDSCENCYVDQTLEVTGYGYVERIPCEED